MGIILSAVATVALAVAAALVTGWLEPKLVRSGGEAGPAAPVMLREDLYPQRTDPWLYVAAPVVALLGLCWAFVGPWS